MLSTSASGMSFRKPAKWVPLLVTVALLCHSPFQPRQTLQAARKRRPNNDSLAAEDSAYERIILDKLRHYSIFEHKLKGGPQPANAWYQDNAEPVYVCPHEQRIGPHGEGGKWMCDPSSLKKQDSCLIYSIGSQDDFRWEAALLQIAPNCQIHVFDHTVHNPKTRPASVHFHPWGLGAVTTTDNSIFTLNDIVDKLGHRGRELSVFKIDCERCEWDTFETWLDAGVHIREILAEVHAGTELPSDNPVARQFMAFMFERNMLIFHKEPNVKYSGGNSLCVEYGFRHFPAKDTSRIAIDSS